MRVKVTPTLNLIGTVIIQSSQLVLSHIHTNLGFLGKGFGLVYLLHIPWFRCSATAL